MRTVVLIGDSIRMGYQDTVRRELAGCADIWVPEENGGTSDNILSHLDAWVIRRRPSLLHLNCGLHDLRKEFGATQAAIPPPVYARNLRALFTVIREKAPCTTVWATTTPVNETWHHATKGFDRFEADVAAYNKIGSDLAREYKLQVDDLYAVAMQAGRDRLLQSDGVHFTPEGYEILGKAVAESIRQALA